MKKIKSKSVRVELQKTEKVRKKLAKEDLLNENLKIYSDKNFAYIPVKDISSEKLEDYEIVEKDFEKNKEKITSYKDILDVPDSVKNELPSSYDVIGDIALVKLNEDLKIYKKKIGEALLIANKNIKTVALIDSVSGEFRTRNIDIIAGEKKTKTVHKEFGLEYIVDIEKVYFSPRLANERKRITNLVKKDEVVVDMFTGVAPFPIMISKYSNPKTIFAIDKNKDAIDLAKINVRKNRVYEKIKLFCKDSKYIGEIIDKDIKVDRVIMNLPFSSYNFFENALDLTKKKCIYHYYEMLSDEKIEKRIKDLQTIASKRDIKICISKINRIKTYSPREFYIGIDITAKKKTMPT